MFSDGANGIPVSQEFGLQLGYCPPPLMVDVIKFIASVDIGIDQKAKPVRSIRSSRNAERSYAPPVLIEHEADPAIVQNLNVTVQQQKVCRRG